MVLLVMNKNLSNLCVGIYNLNVLDDNNCIQSSSIEIFQPEILTSNINIIPLHVQVTLLV